MAQITAVTLGVLLYAPCGSMDHFRPAEVLYLSGSSGRNWLSLK